MGKDSLRPCIVYQYADKQKIQTHGWFHCWEQYSEVVGESPLRGGHAEGHKIKTESNATLTV